MAQTIGCLWDMSMGTTPVRPREFLSQVLFIMWCGYCQHLVTGALPLAAAALAGHVPLRSRMEYS
jgi:hypothetical protein